MGIQAVKGVEIGDGFALAGLRGSQAHDEIVPHDGLRRRRTVPAGSRRASPTARTIVVRAAMKPLPTLMRPLRPSTSIPASRPRRSWSVGQAAVEALAVVAEAAVAFELARAAREKFGGDAIGDFVAAHRAYLERIDWQPTR